MNETSKETGSVETPRGTLNRLLGGLTNDDLDQVLQDLHRERMLRRNRGAEAEHSADQVAGRLARETSANVGPESAYPGKQAMPAAMGETAGRLLEGWRPSSLSSELRELSNRIPRVMHLAGREFERLEIRDAKRRAQLEHSQLVPRLMAAAWNAMQVHRSTTPIPVWLVELVDVSREAAGVLLEDSNPTQGPKL
jgi:hypothetical protein